MGHRTITGVLALALLPAMAVAATPIRTPLEQLRETDLRVATTAFRLVTGNVARCPDKMPATGLVLHSLAQYRASSRAAVQVMIPLPSPVSVLGVVTGSPADVGGVTAGDGIEAINGAPLATAVPSGAPATWLRDRAEQDLAALPPQDPLRLVLRRGAQTQDRVITPQPACRARIEVVAGNAIVARSDGRVIQIGQAFAERIDDGGLAVTVAHELAHTILSHRRRLALLEQAPPSAENRRKHAALARLAEDEADLLSLHLLAGGGWDPAIAPRFMLAEGRRFETVWPGTKPHRSSKQRAQRMTQELAAMRAAALAPAASDSAGTDRAGS